MPQKENIPDKGLYCWDCDGYYWYDEIKDNKCPNGHIITGDIDGKE